MKKQMAVGKARPKTAIKCNNVTISTTSEQSSTLIKAKTQLTIQMMNFGTRHRKELDIKVAMVVPLVTNETVSFSFNSKNKSKSL